MVSRTAALALLAVACLVLAGSAPTLGATSAAPAGAQAGDPQTFQDWVLTLEETPERSAVGDVGLDVGRSLDTQRSDAVVAVQRIGLEQRLEAASSDQERFEILRSELETMTVRVEGIYSAEREALAQYRQGEMTAREYLERTAFLDARVGQYMETVSVIESEGERIQAAAIGRDAAELRTRGTVVGGPLQGRVRSAYTGEIEPVSVRVDASPGGYVALAVVDDVAVRQSHRYDQRATDDVPTNDLRTALDHVYSQYPDETDDVGSIGVGGQQSSGVFYVSMTTNEDVAVTSFVDNRNLTVFKEVYRQPLEQVPVEDSTTAVESGVRLEVETHPQEGLVHVRTSDADSGEPVATAVSVGGEPVGTAGPDGDLWLVVPRGATNVTARLGTGRSVSAPLP